MVLRFQSPFSLFVYIFKRLLDLDQKLAEYEFSRVSLHSVCQSARVELFSIGLIWKFSKSFFSIEIVAKCRYFIVIRFGAYILF